MLRELFRAKSYSEFGSRQLFGKNHDVLLNGKSPSLSAQARQTLLWKYDYQSQEAGPFSLARPIRDCIFRISASCQHLKVMRLTLILETPGWSTHAGSKMTMSPTVVRPQILKVLAQCSCPGQHRLGLRRHSFDLRSGYHCGSKTQTLSIDTTLNCYRR